MQDWANYFIAMTGAAAGLTGLIFIGISISLAKILSMPSLVDRGLKSLMLLVNVMILSSLCLIPGQPLWLLGTEILILSLMVWGLIIWLDSRSYRNTEKEYKRIYLNNIILSQLAILPYIIGSLFILLSGGSGIYWLVLGIICSILKSLLDAWVLLIEINR